VYTVQGCPVQKIKGSSLLPTIELALRQLVRLTFHC
jgi:hypothetical protein